MFSRRQFLSLSAGSCLVSLSPSVPRFLLNAAAAENTGKSENILVVVQLTGGNDGLNTVIPYTNEEYRKSRPVLGIPTDQVLKVSADLGFHPSMKGLEGLLQQGRLAVMQGIGYPNPNRSHFESMDIWHTARMDPKKVAAGWLGQYLDAMPRDNIDAPALHFGEGKQPLALASRNAQAVSVASLDQFRLEVQGNVKETIEQSTAAPRPGASDLLQFVQSSTVTAIKSSRRVEEAVKSYKTSAKYPAGALADRMRTIAQLIGAGLASQIYYVALDGFDTHSTQPAAHASLLEQFSGAMSAFVDDLAEHGQLDRVLVVAFSEFGRRVKENASQGTDHGAAAPVFLAGGRVKSGFIGDHPSMTDLDDGDLKFHTDFRSLYAEILQSWLAHPSAAVLGGEFAPTKVLTV